MSLSTPTKVMIEIKVLVHPGGMRDYLIFNDSACQHQIDRLELSTHHSAKNDLIDFEEFESCLRESIPCLMQIDPDQEVEVSFVYRDTASPQPD